MVELHLNYRASFFFFFFFLENRKCFILDGQKISVKSYKVGCITIDVF